MSERMKFSLVVAAWVLAGFSGGLLCPLILLTDVLVGLDT